MTSIDNNFKREYLSAGNSLLKKYNADQEGPQFMGEVDSLTPPEIDKDERPPTYDGLDDYAHPKEIDRIESATKLLVEGYKRVQKGKKNVTFTEVLKSLNIGQDTQDDYDDYDEYEDYDNYDEYDEYGDYENYPEESISGEDTFNKSEFITDSGINVPGFAETQKVASKF